MRGGRGGRGDRAAAQADLAPAWRRRRCGPRAGRNGGHPFRDGPLSRDRPLSPLRGLMRRLLFACCAALLLYRPAPAVAQTGPEPTLILTLFGGAATGHKLWHVGRQPLCVYAADLSCSSQHDTLELSRDISSSLVIGVSGSYFKSPHVGIEAEVFFLGFPFDDSCRGIYFNADPNQVNEQACLNI